MYTAIKLEMKECAKASKQERPSFKKNRNRVKVKPQILTGKQTDGVSQLKKRLWQEGQAYYSIMKHHQVNERMNAISKKEENHRRKVRPKYDKEMTIGKQRKKCQKIKIQKTFLAEKEKADIEFLQIMT